MKNIGEKNNGGVTFSGGEALLQIRELEPLLVRLKEHNVHLAVETAMFVPIEFVRLASKYIDFFYIDVKLLDSELCRTVLGGEINQYISNIEYIATTDKEVVFRIPFSDRFTMHNDNLNKMKDFLGKYNQYPIEVFKLHQLGEAKYKSLGMNIAAEYSAEQMPQFIEMLEKDNMKISVIQI